MNPSIVSSLPQNSLPEKHPVYTFSDLENWNHTGTSLAVVGHPISHSLSPVLHNTALRQMAVTHPQFKNYHYFRFDIDPSHIQFALKKFHEKNFLGLNITTPYKLIAFETAITHDDTAIEAGCSNTLLRVENGYKAYNTDGYGFEKALEACELDVKLKDHPIVLLGAGGAARSAAVQCLRAGCRELWIGNRSENRLKTLVNEVLKPIAKDIRIHTFLFEAFGNEWPLNSLFVNATTLGRSISDPSPLADGQLPSVFQAFDMNYGAFKSAFLRQAEAKGCSFLNGLSMLVHQAAASLALWTQQTVPTQKMFIAAQSALSENTVVS
jgi:shikimate dehydrogenase